MDKPSLLASEKPGLEPPPIRDATESALLDSHAPRCHRCLSSESRYWIHIRNGIVLCQTCDVEWDEHFDRWVLGDKLEIPTPDGKPVGTWFFPGEEQVKKDSRVRWIEEHRCWVVDVRPKERLVLHCPKIRQSQLNLEGDYK